MVERRDGIPLLTLVCSLWEDVLDLLLSTEVVLVDNVTVLLQRINDPFADFLIFDRLAELLQTLKTLVVDPVERFATLTKLIKRLVNFVFEGLLVETGAFFCYKFNQLFHHFSYLVI